MDDTRWLIAREIPRLRRYALALAGSPEAADDLVQDCLERAIRKHHLWSRRGSVRSWLYRILYNVFLNQANQRDHLRRQIPVEALSAEATAAAAASPARQVDQIVCREIGAAMRALPVDQRAAIVLTAVEELSYDEAAEVLGIPVGTLRSRLSRGREKLREIYAGPRTETILRRVK